MTDLEMVDICHPDVDGSTSVPKSAYEDHWVRSGWTLVDPPDERAWALELLARGGMPKAVALRVLAPESPPDPPAAKTPTDQAPEAPPSGLSHAQDQPPKSRRASKEES